MNQLYESKLLSLFETFDPTEVKISSNQDDDSENRFLNGFLKMLYQARFRPLTCTELEFAKGEDYLCTLPVSADWDQFDSTFFPQFINSKNLPIYSRKYIKKMAPEISKNILIFHRGTGIDRTTNMLMMEKIDVLIVSFYWFFVSLLDWRSWGRVTSETVGPTEEPTSFKLKFLTRKSLKDSLNFYIWKETEIQEPTFKEVILIYRLDEPNSEKKNNIYLRSFKNIPMADIEVTFPKMKRSSLRPTDIIQFTIQGALGILTLVLNLSSKSNSTLAYASLVGFLMIIFKAWSDYWLVSLVYGPQIRVHD
eukprot:TRINITY_DN3114_c0_g1_i5.p1 TRINITY_DN3114_c0_g1~~TRINITY_DN3114_c0_g1_i5.p1  ORF type:complete len:308 (-),score=58.04 TRINITY_DN3114_c0_g1_i5:478-1401(-)